LDPETLPNDFLNTELEMILELRTCQFAVATQPVNGYKPTVNECPAEDPDL